MPVGLGAKHSRLCRAPAAFSGPHSGQWGVRPRPLQLVQLSPPPSRLSPGPPPGEHLPCPPLVQRPHRPLGKLNTPPASDPEGDPEDDIATLPHESAPCSSERTHSTSVSEQMRPLPHNRALAYRNGRPLLRCFLDAQNQPFKKPCGRPMCHTDKGRRVSRWTGHKDALLWTPTAPLGSACASEELQTWTLKSPHCNTSAAALLLTAHFSFPHKSRVRI